MNEQYYRLKVYVYKSKNDFYVMPFINSEKDINDEIDRYMNGTEKCNKLVYVSNFRSNDKVDESFVKLKESLTFDWTNRKNDDWEPNINKFSILIDPFCEQLYIKMYQASPNLEKLKQDNIKLVDFNKFMVIKNSLSSPEGFRTYRTVYCSKDRYDNRFKGIKRAIDHFVKSNGDLKIPDPVLTRRTA